MNSCGTGKAAGNVLEDESGCAFAWTGATQASGLLPPNKRGAESCICQSTDSGGQFCCRSWRAAARQLSKSRAMVTVRRLHLAADRRNTGRKQLKLLIGTDHVLAEIIAVNEQGVGIVVGGDDKGANPLQ